MACVSYCNGDCYTGCNTTCKGSSTCWCGSDCYPCGWCDGGCLGSCSGGCNTTCNDTCSGNCTGNCSGNCNTQCNSGCSGSANQSAYTNLTLDTYYKSSDIDNLKAVITAARARRGLSTSHPNMSVGTSISASAMTTEKTNLSDIGFTSSYSFTQYSTALKEAGNDLIKKAKAAFETMYV